MKIKLLILAFFTLGIIDLTWIGGIATSFYLHHMSELANIENGRFVINYPAAILVYVALSMGLVFYVLPQIDRNANWPSAILRGAGFGLCVYGVYDLTNLATLRSWPIILTLADMIWGAILCAIVALILKTTRDKFLVRN